MNKKKQHSKSGRGRSKKIVIIGAGSLQFGRGILMDFLKSKELQGKGIQLWLVDVDEQALKNMYRFAKLAAKHVGSDMKLYATTDRTEALPNATYVLTAVSVRRWELWEQDFRIPLAYGFRHPLGENGGPGALFHALRSLNLIIPICRDMERLCPDALLLNFTNPEGRVLDAILHLTKVRAAGLCHGVFNAIRFVSEYMDVPANKMEFTSAGLNHFYMVLKIIHKESGKDLLPAVLARASRDEVIWPSVWMQFIKVFGWLSYKSDDHIGEYVPYGAEFVGVKWPYGLERRRIEQQRPGPQVVLEPYLNGAPLDDGILSGTTEIAVPVICAMETNHKTRVDAVNVLNTGSYIKNLPRTAVIEVPAVVDAKGLHPISVGAIPEGPAALMRTQLSIQRLLTEAYRTGSKNLLLQALLIDPVVNSTTAAKKMLDDMLELQRDFLPPMA
jgi:alpha-galactosidase